MPVRKFRKFDDSVGITLPKDDLRRDGIVDEETDEIELQACAIDRVGEGEYRIQAIDK